MYELNQPKDKKHSMRFLEQDVAFINRHEGKNFSDRFHRLVRLHEVVGAEKQQEVEELGKKIIEQEQVLIKLCKEVNELDDVLQDMKLVVEVVCQQVKGE